MSEAIRAELMLLFGSLSAGLSLMALYDGLRVFRMLIPHGSWWTGLEDVLYWLYVGFSSFLLLFHQNDGILRWYAILGVLAGMLFYNLTVSRIFLGVLKKAGKYFTMRRKKSRNQTEKGRRAEWQESIGTTAGKRKKRR